MGMKHFCFKQKCFINFATTRLKLNTHGFMDQKRDF